MKKFYNIHGWMVKCHHKTKSLLNLLKEIFKTRLPKKRNISLKNKNMRPREKELTEVVMKTLIQIIPQVNKWKTSSKSMETTITCFPIPNQMLLKPRSWRFYKDKTSKSLQMRRNTKLCLNKKISPLTRKMLNTVRKFKFRSKLLSLMPQHVLLNSTSFQAIRFSSWLT